MISKKQKAISFFENEEYKKAFKIFKTFKLEFNKDENRILDLTYEILAGRGRFYENIGIDCNEMCRLGFQLICEKYNL